MAAANIALAIPARWLDLPSIVNKQPSRHCTPTWNSRPRKLALDTAKTYRKVRTAGCTFDEALELTSPLKREDVIQEYCTQQEALGGQGASNCLQMAAGTVPWFVALSLTVSFPIHGGHVPGDAANRRLRSSLRGRAAGLRRRDPEDWPLRRSRRRHPRRNLATRCGDDEQNPIVRGVPELTAQLPSAPDDRLGSAAAGVGQWRWGGKLRSLSMPRRHVTSARPPSTPRIMVGGSGTVRKSPSVRTSKRGRVEGRPRAWHRCWSKR